MMLNGLRFAALATLGLLGVARLDAQAPADSGAVMPTSRSEKSSPPLPFAGGPWVTGINVWAGGAVQTRTASHNEIMDGSLRMVGVQFTRSLFVAGGVHFSWIVEALPIMLVTSGAPANRIPKLSEDPVEASDPGRRSRYDRHDSFGMGIAPLSAQASRPLGSRLTAVFSVTSGGAIFTHVVPYGKATQANFSVSPAVLMEWNATRASAVAVGYTLHHLSNMSMGGSNPGMNSHMFFVRVSKEKYGRN